MVHHLYFFGLGSALVGVIMLSTSVSYVEYLKMLQRSIFTGQKLTKHTFWMYLLLLCLISQHFNTCSHRIHVSLILSAAFLRSGSSKSVTSTMCQKHWQESFLSHLLPLQHIVTFIEFC